MLQPDARVQLLNGIVYAMPPIGSGHSGDRTGVSRVLQRRLPGENLLVRDQEPVTLDDLSEPEPDVAVVQWRDNLYRDRHPRPDEVLLLVEVADSTLEFDLCIKARDYARSGIEEYWVLDVQARRLIVHRGPHADGYREIIALEAGDRVTPVAFPDVTILVAELLGV